MLNISEIQDYFYKNNFLMSTELMYFPFRTKLSCYDNNNEWIVDYSNVVFFNFKYLNSITQLKINTLQQTPIELINFILEILEKEFFYQKDDILGFKISVTKIQPTPVICIVDFYKNEVCLCKENMNIKNVLLFGGFRPFVLEAENIIFK